MKQYARPDRLLRTAEMRRSAALMYEKAGDTSAAKTQLDEALKFLSDYSGELDRSVYDNTRHELQSERNAIKTKS